MFAGATIAQLEGHAWATSLVISAGIVLLLISAVISALMARMRDCAIELITGGRETLPIAVVQRERGACSRAEGPRSLPKRSTR
jgi:hypothetical protein